MVAWHHQLNGHEFEQTLGDGEGQGSLVCCSPWGRKESDTTERPNNKLKHQGHTSRRVGRVGAFHVEARGHKTRGKRSLEK